MMVLYFACLIIGGIFIAVSLIAGTDTEVGIDGVADAGTGTDAAVSGEAEMPEGEGTAAVIKFLSFRNIVFFIAFFGLTGSVLTLLNGPFLINLFAALLMGFFSAAIMHRVMSHLMQNEVGQAMNLEGLAGFPAKVTVSLTKSRKGKISLQANGRSLQLLANAAEEAQREDFHQGEEVLILRIEGGIAQVVEKEFI